MEEEEKKKKKKKKKRGGGWGVRGGGEKEKKKKKEYDFLSLHFFSASDLLCLRSSRSKCNVSTVNCLLVFFYTST